jgi:hypothetical protein
MLSVLGSHLFASHALLENGDAGSGALPTMKKCDDEMDRLLGLWCSRLTVAVPIWMTTASEERLRHIDDIEEGLFATMTTLEASHNIEWGDFSPDAVSPDVWEAIVATYRLYRRAAAAGGDPPTVQVESACSGASIGARMRKWRAAAAVCGRLRRGGQQHRRNQAQDNIDAGGTVLEQAPPGLMPARHRSAPAAIL